MSNKENEFGGIIGRTYKESTSYWPEPVKAPDSSPNVVFIILDDVGFSQIGCYGSEIETPNMDRLAQNGLLFNNFHTTALCSPTRACLLTGRNHHSVGTAIITDLATGYPGYNGRIPRSAATIAQILKENGYNTMAVGKWHNTPSEDLSAAGPYDHWPLGMGFERFYGFLAGETNQWKPDLVYDNHRIETPDRPGYHVSEDIVDKSIGFILDQKQANPDKPAFLWLSFGAGHAPHHAPKEYIEKYKGKFDKGWDKVREEVLIRQKEMGVVPQDTELAPSNPRVKPWDTLSDDERKLFARMQEVYAGFMDHTDHQIGRFVNFLEKIGELDNTLIMLISDNGASREGGPNGTVNEIRFFNAVRESLEANLEMIDELGGPLTYNHYPRGWAQAGNSPLKRFKQNTHGGGIRDPLIVHWPKGIKNKGQIRQQYHHVIDLVPTVYDIIGINPPDEFNGIQQKPIEGISMAYTFNDGDASTRKEMQYYEMFGHRGLWHDGWKAVTYHEWGSKGNFDDDKWELYHIDEDFSECHDLAEQYPEKLKEMIDLWWREAEKYQVLPLDDRTNERFYIDKPPRDKDRKTFTYYPDTSMMPSSAAPPIRNRSHFILAEVDIPEGSAEGVLIAHGGRFAGYALYIKDNRLVYDHNFLGIEHYIVTSEIDVPAGPSNLGFKFEKSGEHQGIGQLFINGQKVGEAPIARTIPVSYGPEGLEIGRDTLTPVSENYTCPFKFTGILKKVVVTVDGEPHLDPEGDFKAAMGEQ
ncbi:MAG: arylsulfatase [Deltaproteobacteria bacterium]|nr:arylsulfatase [Deltaproteobacteria bacterium]MBW2051130.1 arylsulfatase [Deltaproteobacteria bacterium]MBW2140726.1 arylsulfatase [Deltaproteobacteria bacterium]MBW2322855.1 arylsulfatase [Deltaproteobacteria bacterium]